MNQQLYLLAFVAVFILSAFAASQDMAWNIEETYQVEFVSDEPSGVFRGLEGKIVFDPERLAASSFQVRVDAATISTGNGLKDRHARTEKWFGVEEFPYITFESTEVSSLAEGYVVEGALTLHGVTREVKIPFTFVDDTFRGSFAVDRRDYNLGPTKGLAAKPDMIQTVNLVVPVSR